MAIRMNMWRKYALPVINGANSPTASITTPKTSDFFMSSSPHFAPSQQSAHPRGVEDQNQDHDGKGHAVLDQGRDVGRGHGFGDAQDESPDDRTSDVAHAPEQGYGKEIG